MTIKILTLANKSLMPSEILKEIRKFQSINKVTLYRILDLLEKKEIVRKILTSDDVSRYELIDPLANGNQNLPPRFVCRICKAIIPVNSPEIQSMVSKKLGNAFCGPIEIVIEGICFNCKKEKK
jgi:Fe2+ or Zn2+ uptake regulation protein